MRHPASQRSASVFPGLRARALAVVAVLLVAPLLAAPDPADGRAGGDAELAQSAGLAEPLVPSGVADDGAFGSDVAISGSGDVAVVGAPLDGPGSATVFQRAGALWVEVVRLAPVDGAAGDRFGAAVALDGNGDIAVVGAPGADGGAGAVYVFTGPDWDASDAARVPSGGPGAFGFDVALDDAGDTLVVGNPGAPGEPGAAWVLTGPDWLGNPVLNLPKPASQPDDRFGESTAASGDGSTVAVGAPNLEIEGVASGAAVVYRGTDLAERVDVRPLGPAAGHRIGTAVALDGAGTRLVVGAPGMGDGGTVWRFEESDDFSANTAASLLIEAPAGAEVGTALAVSTSGATVVVGAPGIPGAFLVVGAPDPAEAEPIPLPEGPHGFAIDLDGAGGRCVAGTFAPTAAPAARMRLAGTVPASAATAAFCHFGDDITGTVTGQFDPDEDPDDPPDGFRQARPPEVRVTLYKIPAGFTGSCIPEPSPGCLRIGVPQYLDTQLSFGFFVSNLPPSDYMVVARPTRNAGHGHSVEPGTETKVTFPPGARLFDPPDGTGSLRLDKQLLAEGDSSMEPAIRQDENLPRGATVVWHGFPGTPTHVAFQACPGGSGTFSVFEREPDEFGAEPEGGPMFVDRLTESARFPGRYTGTFAGFAELTPMTVQFDVACPNPPNATGRLEGLIDPSGRILNTFGDPVPGATVVLYRQVGRNGAFVLEPEGDPERLLPPTNPLISLDTGYYGWLVERGRWKVRAMKEGCQSPSRPGVPFVDSAILPVPPEQTNIDLTLDCGGQPRPLTVREPVRACPFNVPEDGFADVPEDNVHETRVDCVTWWEVARGVAAGRFGPELPTTRAQMATFLVRVFAAVDEPLPPGPDAFPDDDGTTHEADIDALAAAGIARGRPDGTFGPDVPVSRDQMASFLVRTLEELLGHELDAPRDAFDDDDGNTHEEAIDKAAFAGIAGGQGEGVYAPSAPTRRDQMASFLARTLDALLEEAVGSLPD